MQVVEHGCRRAWRVIVTMVTTTLLHEAAAAAENAPNKDAAATPTAQLLPDALRQLTDPGGWRSRLEQAGLQFALTYYGDGFGNRGGVTQGLGYDGRFGIIIDADMEKLADWSGTSLHASIHQIHGSQFSATRLQNFALVSSIEAPPSTRLFNLWMEQKIGSDVNLRLGQFSAAQEFLVSQTAALFVNTTFGWPMLPDQDLPSGGPSYPEATPGIRVAFTPADQLTLRAAIFNGDPAGPGAGNPVDRDPYGLAFRLRDPPLLIAELAYAWNQGKSSLQENPHQEGGGRPAAQAQTQQLAGGIKFGAWLHTGQFVDQRFDNRGGLLAVSGAPPLQHSGNFGVYGIIDQTLWRAPGNSPGEFNAFMRVVAAPADRNLIDIYLDAGMTYKGLVDSRPDDTAGLGVAYGRVSPRATAFNRDVVTLTGQAMPIRDYEAVVELSYQMKLADNWSLQPNLQYVIHPGGHVPDPLDPSGTNAIRDALVFGMRTMLKF